MFYIFYSFSSGRHLLKKASTLMALKESLIDELQLDEVNVKAVIEKASKIMIESVLKNVEPIEVGFVENTSTSWATVFYERVVN